MSPWQFWLKLQFGLLRNASLKTVFQIVNSIACGANVLGINDESRHFDAFPSLRKNQTELYLGNFKKNIFKL